MKTLGVINATSSTKFDSRCGKLLNAIELINPKCKLDGATPISRDSNHLFLNLTEHQPILEKWYKKASHDGV
jgi:methionyl-tRNA synthetase